MVDEEKREIQVEVKPWWWWNGSWNDKEKSWDNKVKDIQDKHLQTESSSPLVDDQRDRLKQNKYVVRQRFQLDQSLDVSRELEMLGVEPYDEVARTIAFIKNHTNLLKEKSVQDILRIHLFRAGRLSSQLKDEPSITENMAVSIEHALKNYLQLEDLDTCLFLVKLGNDFKVFAEKQGIESKMPSYREVVLKKIIPQFKGDRTAKYRAYQTLVSFYEKIDTTDVRDNEEMKTKIAEDVIGLSVIRAIHGDPVDREFDPKVRAVQLRMLPLIEELLDQNGQTKDDILNNLVKIVHPNSAKYKWKGKSPSFECERYKIDVKDGTVIDKEGGEFSALPQRVLRDDLFRAIFKGEIVSCEKKEDDRTYVINAGLEDELIVRAWYNKLEFQQKIGGVVCRYMETPKVLFEKAPTLFDSSVHCWVHDGDHPEIIALKEGRNHVACVKLSKKPGDSYHIDRVHRYRSDRTADTSQVWVPFEKAPSIQYLQKLEKDPNYIECWMRTGEGKGKPELSEVHLKRLGLSFVVKEFNGKRTLFSQQFPGYYLVENPKIPSLAKTEQFLTLANMSGERKVLVPRCPLEVTFHGAPFDRGISQASQKEWSWLEYEIKNGDLCSRKVEAQLYRVYLWVARGNFDKAFALLNQITALDRFTDNLEENILEQTIIQWLFAVLVKDKHPSSDAILLQLAAMVEHNHLKYSLPVNGKKEDEVIRLEMLLKGYQSYYRNHTNTTTTRLSEKQERLVLDLIVRCVDDKIEKAKKDKDAKKVQELQFDKKKMEALWGERGQYLKKGSAKLGTRTFSLPKPSFEMSMPTGNDLIAIFEQFDAEPDFKLPGYLIQDENFFKKNFFGLYEIARSKSHDKKEQLRKIIDLSASQGRAYYALLKSVSRRPSKYPALAEIRAAHKAYKDAEAAQQAIDRDSYPNSQKFWDARRAADSRVEKARKMRSRTFAKISPSKNFFSKIWGVVKELLKGIGIVMAMRFSILQLFLSGKFSFGTKAYEVFVNRFRSRYRKRKTKDKNAKTVLDCNGKSLKEADKA
ncbi:MAG: hypothetical protein ACE5GN_03760, partial [Waddliaceae bacterium]